MKDVAITEVVHGRKFDMIKAPNQLTGLRIYKLCYMMREFRCLTAREQPKTHLISKTKFAANIDT